MIPKALRGPVLGRLGFRLMAAVGLALAPLALLSYNQAQKIETAAQGRLDSALFGETLRAVTSQINAIGHAKGLAMATAAAVLPVVDDPKACSALMRRLVRIEPDISFAGFIPINGRMDCVSVGKPLDLAGSAGLAARLADPEPQVTVNARAPISGESVLIFSHPVRDAQARLLGFVSLSLPHRHLVPNADYLLVAGKDVGEPLGLVTFDADGTVLTASKGITTVDQRLPLGRPLAMFVNGPPVIFRAATPTSGPRTFAVQAIIPGSLYVLSSWPASVDPVWPIVGHLPLWAFPLAMWLASLLAAWIAAEHQILHPFRSLRRSIVAFAGGNRKVTPPELDAAPNELRDVGDAFERMMTAVLRDEAELEDSVHQKEVLLREVHHRVKNNLQLIASIMNLQMRKAATPEARSLLKGLHERVMSLATVHRELYQTSGLTDVQADELLPLIVSQVLGMGASADRNVETETSFDPIRLIPDQAVPLALILTEALTNALKHAGMTPSMKTRLSVSFRHGEPGHAVLEISSTGAGDAPAPLDGMLESTGIGQQLLGAFASQLRGNLTFGDEGALYVLRLNFPVENLSASELRNSSGQDAAPD